MLIVTWMVVVVRLSFHVAASYPTLSSPQPPACLVLTFCVHTTFRCPNQEIYISEELVDSVVAIGSYHTLRISNISWRSQSEGTPQVTTQ